MCRPSSGNQSDQKCVIRLSWKFGSLIVNGIQINLIFGLQILLHIKIVSGKLEGKQISGHYLGDVSNCPKSLLNLNTVTRFIQHHFLRFFSQGCIQTSV